MLDLVPELTRRRERSRQMVKAGLGVDVAQAAVERIAWTFDRFPRIYLSGPSGKDSGVMMHLACLEARRRGRRLGVLYVDLEAQYARTVAHVEQMFDLYNDVVDPYWLCLPVHLRNATSSHAPYWIAWDPKERDRWVRTPPARAITDWSGLPWYEPPHERAGQDWAMEFEELIEDFGAWYAGDQATACLVGIRSDESLNRWRAIARPKHALEDRCYTTWKGGPLFNVYPIYDWRNDDVWTYYGRTGLPYNTIYDLMHKAGVSPGHQRICQPYGDDQRKGLYLFHVLEPETWPRVVERVSGARMGALYARARGNVLGNGKVVLPAGHTWRSYVEFLLDSMPAQEADHYRDKIAVFIRWWAVNRGQVLVDEGDPKLEAARKIPSWRRIAKVILKNDHCCKGLSFSPQRSTRTAYEQYKRVMRRRRETWGIFPT